MIETPFEKNFRYYSTKKGFEAEKVV